MYDYSNYHSIGYPFYMLVSVFLKYRTRYHLLVLGHQMIQSVRRRLRYPTERVSEALNIFLKVFLHKLPCIIGVVRLVVAVRG